MPHPLDEVKYTPWGQDVDIRLGVMNAKIVKVEQDMIHLELELKVNTNQTNSIKQDTQWLVDMFRGSKALSRFLIGLAVFLGGIAAFGVWMGWHISKS